jgi:NitT/TauT family transport system substrate-binding protein
MMSRLALLGSVLAAVILAACGGGATTAPSGSATKPAGSASAPAASAPATAAPASAQPPAAASPSNGAPAGAAYRPTPLNPAVQLKFAAPFSAGEAGIFAAMDKGYFTEEGLDVELVPMQAAPEIWSQIIAGQLQFGSGGFDPSLVNAVARDISVKLVGYNVIGSPTAVSSGILVRTDHIESGRYKDPGDFRGMNVGIVTPPGAQPDVYMERLGARWGWTLDDVERTFIPFPQMPAAMANKAVDAVQVFQPAASAIEAQGSGKLVVPTGEVFPGFPGEIFVMNPAFGKDQPDVATRVMAAYLRGQRDYWHAFVKKDTPPDEMYEIVAKYTPLKDREVLARALGGLVDPNGEIDPAPLAYSADAFVRYGTATQRIDVNQLIDPSWARAAVERIGRVNP